MAANVKIDIAAEFVGKKAFTDAAKQTIGLNNQVKTLAKSYLGLFTVQRLGRAGFNAAKAFAEDDKAARVLTQSLDNLGLAFADPSVRNFIADLEGIMITQYYVDIQPIDMNDIVTIQGLDEGVLERAGRTIQSAIDINKAAAVASATPMSSGILKNTGADLPPAEVSGLLSAWKRSRQNNSTAYLTSTLEFQSTQFSPKDMMYNEAIQNLSTEIARAMNVPAYYLSADQNTTMTYANVQDERKQFYALSIEPYVQAIQARLSMDDISTSGHEVRFAVFDTFLKNDPLVELQVVEKLLTLGLITTEQAMEMTDLTPNGSEGIS